MLSARKKTYFNTEKENLFQHKIQLVTPQRIKKYLMQFRLYEQSQK